MSELQPIDDGVRRYRPGLMIVLSALVLAGATWFIFQAVASKQGTVEKETPVIKVAKIEEEIRAPAPSPPPPPPPSIHPLEGKRRLFLADGCRYRFHELTFTREFSEQHPFPGAILRENDPCLWNFVGVLEKEDVYRIYCADPNYPDLHEKNLTYTRLLDDGLPQDTLPPYLTLRKNDPCEWKVRELPEKNQYELYCLSGSEAFAGKSLGWMEEQDDLLHENITTTLGENGNPSWFILEEDEKPTLPRRASHLIVMPRGEVEGLAESREDFEENGIEIFRAIIETADDKFTRVAAKLSHLELVKAIRDNDPVIQHKNFPALANFSLTNLTELSAEPDPLFPLIIPLKVALHPHLIHELTLQNTDFWKNTWENLEDFQSLLDESDVADGRVYQGEKFTYIFVSWEP